MPNQFLSDEFGDIEDYFVTDYRLIDNFVGDTLFTWGRGDPGRLGTNNSNNRSIPVTTFAGGTNWKQVACGNDSAAAIKTDGTLWVWGSAAEGKLGTNDITPNRLTPVTTFAGGNDWKQVSCGDFHIAAIKTDGSLWSWGRNSEAELGDNTITNRSTPVTTFAGGNDWKQVSCGFFNTAAIKTDGSLWMWGQGTLGNNNADTRSTPVTTFAGGTTWKSVAACNSHTAAIKTDGTLWTWGLQSYGRLGNNSNIGSFVVTPVTTFAGGTTWKSVFGNGLARHTTAIKTDGSLWTWGRNNVGQLGINDAIDRSTPVTTFAGGTNWKIGSGQGYHTAAIKTDGSLWIWGNNNVGQLGINDLITRSTPVTTFAGGNNWKQVAAGREHTVAIKSGLNVDLS